MNTYAIFVSCALVVCAGVSVGCPAFKDTEHDLLSCNIGLKKLFEEYAHGSVLNSGDLTRLLEDLSSISHDHVTDDHIAHDHSPKDDSWSEKLHRSEGGRHDPIHNELDLDSDSPDRRGSAAAPIKKANATINVRNNSTTEAAKGCDIYNTVKEEGNISDGDHVSASQFLHLCPAILRSVLSCSEESRMHSSDHQDHHDHDDHNHHHTEIENSSLLRDSWIGAIVCMFLIGLVAVICIMIIPIIKKNRHYQTINHFLLSLAVGTLAGDALIHLLPHAFSAKTDSTYDTHLLHSLYGLTAFIGIILFLFIERIHNLIGHRRNHMPQSDPMDGDDLIKEVGAISAELNDNGPSDKIGEKLSQHSKHSSFICADPVSQHNGTASEPRGCFDSCPQTLTSIEDANGNNGADPMKCKGHLLDENSSVAECERLVVANSEKVDQPTSNAKNSIPIPPPPLVQNTPLKRVVRQDSKNFNMVLQEYHVGHHGHSHHGHSHVTGKKESLRTMILLGDGMHTFMDGMAIGAAFGSSLTGGVSTAIAVLCHELPHKVGDFAILFEMGMNRTQALKMFFILWILSIVGVAVGVSIGSIHAVSPWIYSFTAGVFLYLALVDLLSELPVDGGETCNSSGQMLIQCSGMLTGAGIMLIIGIYEHDLRTVLEGTF